MGNHKKKDTPTGVFLFGAALLLRKSGRLRAGDLTCKGNPTKVSLAHIPFLAICGGGMRTTEPVGSHRKAIPIWEWLFCVRGGDPKREPAALALPQSI